MEQDVTFRNYSKMRQGKTKRKTRFWGDNFPCENCMELMANRQVSKTMSMNMPKIYAEKVIMT